MERTLKWGIAGGIISGLTPFFLKAVSYIGIGVSTQATLTIQFQTTDTALASWATKLINYSPNLPGSFLGINLQQVFMLAISGAILFALGGWLYDKLDENFKFGASKPIKLGAVIAIGTLVSGWLLNGWKIPSIQGLIVLAIGSAIAGLAYYWTLSATKQLDILP